MSKNFFDYLKLSTINKIEPVAEELSVSKVARGPGGFLEVYRSVRGRPDSMKNQWYTERHNWNKRREGFIKRHLAQIQKQDEPIWDENGHPTRRHLALMMWAYSPDPEGVLSWLDEMKK